MSGEKLDHIVSGVLYDFMGWLTTREERIVLSSKDSAAPAVQVITEFLKKRGVDQECEPHSLWYSRCSMLDSQQ